MARQLLRQIRIWRVPPNWSSRDWYEEMKAEAAAAGWEAQRDFDPTRGVPLEAFVHQRVWARILRRYRREQAFARRVRIAADGHELDDATTTHSPDANAFETLESLQQSLRRLPKAQRRLIDELYWQGRSVGEIAATLSLSQSAISRRKRRALDQLRGLLD